MAKFRNEDLLLSTMQKIWLGDNNERAAYFDGTALTISGAMTISGSLLIEEELEFSTGVGVDKILDEDDMGSDDVYALATQQSIKAYVSTSISGTVDDSRKSGRTFIPKKSKAITVTFPSPYPSINYTVVAGISNVVDNKVSIYPLVVTAKQVGGFTAKFSGKIDKDNYYLEWITVLD